MEIENRVCDAIEILINRAISKAKYDKTILGTVESCEDATLGKYKIRYQDSAFYAYYENTEKELSDGTSVYVLIPGNDIEKEKTILGTVDKLGKNYVPALEREDNYYKNGINCIKNKKPIYLSSYAKPNYPETNSTIHQKIIYDKNINLIDVDIESVNEYIQQSSALICGAFFKTSLPKEQQYQGNYGISFTLTFINPADKKEFDHTFSIDIDNMTGNPYLLTAGKRQYEIFNIDGANFKEIKMISVFVKNFPNTKEDWADFEDIEISNIEFVGATKIDPALLNGYNLYLTTPDGSFFSKNAPETATLRLLAEIRNKGKKANTSSRQTPFYWFKEDLSINEGSLKYHPYGGRGWRCLNGYHVIFPEENGRPAQIEWIPGSDSFLINFSDALAKENNFKCVAVFEGNTYSTEINIKNFRQKPAITIVAEQEDSSIVNLTCLINNEEKLENKDYVWGIENSAMTLVSIPEYPADNAQKIESYYEKMALLKQYQDQFNNGDHSVEDEINRLTKEINILKESSLVDKNKVLFVDKDDIIDFVFYKCSVFDTTGERTLLGTAQLLVTNGKENPNKKYSLVINNGNLAFPYDENGISPASQANEKPMQIPALTFSIFDNNGSFVDKNKLQDTEITWKVPLKGTLLKDVRSENTPPSEETRLNNDDYDYIKNAISLAYGLEDRFRYDCQNNQIELTVKYQDEVLIATTAFNFLKQGDAGTNGTAYSTKITPYINTGSAPDRAIFTVVNGASQKWNFNPARGKTQPFSVRLYKEGKEIFNGLTAARSTEGLPVTLKWEMLKNKYTPQLEDPSNFEVEPETGILTYKARAPLGPNPTINAGEFDKYGDRAVANILRCVVTYEGHTLYATLPITIVYIDGAINADDYKVQVRDFTGFKTATYASDGSAPQYDTTAPFTIDIFKKINGRYERISMSNTGGEGVPLIKDFTWEILGTKFSPVEKVFIDASDIISGDLNKKKTGNVYANENFSGILATVAQLTDHTEVGKTYYILENEQMYICKKDPHTPGEVVWDKMPGGAPHQFKAAPIRLTDGLVVSNAIICNCEYREGETVVTFKTHIPIHTRLNRYGFSNLNGWDGNSVKIDDKKGGYILSPQIGTGKKVFDPETGSNLFTGLVMGTAKEANGLLEKIGLLGFSKGQQSIFLDAETGIAEFGTDKSGKLIIDPTKETAKIQSGNYKEASMTPSGTPIEGQGMRIDFSIPEIKFGSGLFKVSGNGEIEANAGVIGGWIIQKDSLQSLEHTSSEKEKTFVEIKNNGNILCRDVGSKDDKGIRWELRSDGGAVFNSVAINGGTFANVGGTIGGWSAEENALTNKNTLGVSNYITMSGKDNLIKATSLAEEKTLWELDGNQGSATFTTLKGTSATLSSIESNSLQVKTNPTTGSPTISLEVNDQTGETTIPRVTLSEINEVASGIPDKTLTIYGKVALDNDQALTTNGVSLFPQNRYTGEITVGKDTWVFEQGFCVGLKKEAPTT